MKQRVETEKFYPAYPVFVLTYLNEIGEPQMSTGSSSYTLGDSIVIGVSAEVMRANTCMLAKNSQ